MYFGNTKIIESNNNLSNDDKKLNLKNLYDVLNEIAKDLSNHGENIKKYFHTNKQYEAIKRTSKNLI